MDLTWIFYFLNFFEKNDSNVFHVSSFPFAHVFNTNVANIIHHYFEFNKN